MSETITAPAAPDPGLDEPRIIREEGLAARVAALVEPVAIGLGFRLVRVKLSGEAGYTLQIMAERPSGEFSIEDCMALSHAVSPVLDVEDPIDRAYRLEVSSPGIDRPLVRVSDFERWLGFEARVELSAMHGGRKRFRGNLVAVAGGDLAMDLPDVPAGKDPRVTVPLALVAGARLVMTDALIDEAQRRAALRAPPEGAIDDGAEIDPEQAETVDVRLDKRRKTRGRQR